MIVGIGIDMVESSRFLDWSLFKKQRIFTQKELDYADKNSSKSEKHLANFWAVREAFLKALGTGFNDKITFSDISVIHSESGKPEILITGGAKAILKEMGCSYENVHLSITDQSEYSVAVVIIEKL